MLSIRRRGQGIENAAEGKDKVMSGHRLTIVPLCILPQVERIGQFIFGDAPILGKSRREADAPGLQRDCG